MLKIKKNHSNEFNNIKNSTLYAKKLGLEVHAGHGLDYNSTMILKKIPFIEEYNIGHFIIGESIMHGLKKVVLNFKNIIKK